MVKRLATLRNSDSFAGNVSLLVGGTALGQAAAILVLPLLTRLYTPENLGSLTVFGSILSFLGVIASLSYEKAITVPAEDDEAANVLGVSLAVLLLIAAVSAVFFQFWGTWLLHLCNAPDLIPYRWMISVGLVAVGVYQSLSFWALRRNAFTKIAQTKVVQSVGQAVSQVVLGFAKLGSLGLLIGDVFGRAGGSSTLATMISREDRPHLRAITSTAMRKAARDYGRFPLVANTAAILHLAATALPPLLFAALYSREVAGWYQLGQRFVWAPMALVGQAFAQVFIAKASADWRTERTEIRQLMLSSMRKLLLIGVIPIAILFVAGGPIFALVFGEAWRNAGLYIQILAWTQLAQFVVGPIFPVLNVIGRQKALLLCDLFGFTVIVGGIILCRWMGWPPTAAMLAYGLGTIAMYGALGWTTYRAVSA